MLVEGGRSYCDLHAKEEVKWKPDAARGNRHQRGYGSAWDRLRAAVLRRDEGVCQPCSRLGRITEAKEVDHIIAKAAGGTDDPANLQAICVDCHASKTGRERLRKTGIANHSCQIAPKMCVNNTVSQNDNGKKAIDQC